MDTDCKRVQGGADAPPFQKVNLRKGRYAVRWDYREGGDGTATYMEAVFGHEPGAEEVREVVNGYYNRLTDEKILTGFVWKGTPVWLSQENQFNYKAAYDLAVQTGGASLPVTFKLGTDAEPVYHRFEAIDELQDFYTKALKHVMDALDEGWKAKDGVDLSCYK